jgi:hypothetical protein
MEVVTHEPHLPPLPLDKRTRVIFEAVRTAAAVVSATGTICVILRVYGVI